MMIRPAAFDEVFDRRSAYAPYAIVNASMDEVARRVGGMIVEGEDELDCFTAVPLAAGSPDNPLTFALWRHKGNPPGTFAVHFRLDELNVSERLVALIVDSIIRDLGVSPDSIVWRSWDELPRNEDAQVLDSLTA